MPPHTILECIRSNSLALNVKSSLRSSSYTIDHQLHFLVTTNRLPFSEVGFYSILGVLPQSEREYAAYLWPEIFWCVRRLQEWRNVDPRDLQQVQYRGTATSSLKPTSESGYVSATSTAQHPAPYPQSKTFCGYCNGGKMSLSSNIMLKILCCCRSRDSSCWSLVRLTLCE